MTIPTARGGFRTVRRLLTGLAVAAATVLLTATGASATGPGFYGFSADSAAGFSAMTAGNLVSGRVDDQLFPLSTTGSGLHRLPFPLHVYNETFQRAVISANGNVQLGVTVGQATPIATEGCLPTRAFGPPAVLPYWDDLVFNAPGVQHPFVDGIFVRTAGAAPHRTFTVGWQGEEAASGRPVLAQAVFAEGSQRVLFRYGTTGGGSVTIGIQSKQQLTSAMWACDSSRQDDVTSGLRLTLDHTAMEPPA